MSSHTQLETVTVSEVCNDITDTNVSLVTSGAQREFKEVNISQWGKNKKKLTISDLKVPFLIVLDQNQNFINLKTKIRCDKWFGF